MALTDKCIAYYKCDTGSGSTLFDSVGNNHLSINGATWTTGKIGNGLSFDGVNNYVGSDDSIVSPIFSLSFWAKGGGGGAILGDSGRPVNCFTGFIVFDDFSIYISTSGWGCGIEKTRLESNYTPTGGYEHIVLTRDGPTWRLYINGSLQNSANLPFNNGNNDRFTIGAAWNSWSGNYERYSNTDIDEVGIWNRALTSTEVSELYNSGDGLQYGTGTFVEPEPDLTDGLISYYKMDTGSGTTAFDSVNQEDISLNNTNWVSGKIGSALEFNGSNSYGLVNFSSSNRLSNSNTRTLTCWFKSTGEGTIFDISRGISGSGNDNSSFRTVIIADGNARISFRRGLASNTNIIIPGDFNDGNWHFVVFEFRNGRIDIIIDDNITGGGSTVTESFNLSYLTVGRRVDNTVYFDGIIDEIGYWNRTLTSTEISELYNSGDGLQYPFGTTPSTKKGNIFFGFGGGKG